MTLAQISDSSWGKTGELVDQKNYKQVFRLRIIVMEKDTKSANLFQEVFWFLFVLFCLFFLGNF